jgi:hypothetical protein
VRIFQPLTLRMLIWLEASNAQNNVAAVSAEGRTVWVLIRRLNSSCNRSIAFVVLALRHWLGGRRVKVKRGVTGFLQAVSNRAMTLSAPSGRLRAAIGPDNGSHLRSAIVSPINPIDAMLQFQRNLGTAVSKGPSRIRESQLESIHEPQQLLELALPSLESNLKMMLAKAAILLDNALKIFLTFQLLFDVA